MFLGIKQMKVFTMTSMTQISRKCFCILEMSGGGVQKAATATIGFGWKKFKDMASVQYKRVLSLKPEAVRKLV